MSTPEPSPAAKGTTNLKSPKASPAPTRASPRLVAKAASSTTPASGARDAPATSNGADTAPAGAPEALAPEVRAPETTTKGQSQPQRITFKLNAASFQQYRDKQRDALKKEKEAKKENVPAGLKDDDSDGDDDGPSSSSSVPSPAAAAGQQPRPLQPQPPAAAAGPVALVYSDAMELHYGPPNHPEQPQRHACVVRRFKGAGLADRCSPLEPRPATDEELLRVHPRTHIAAVEAMFDQAQAADRPVQTSGDLFFSRHTAAAARLSAGCAAEAAAAVAAGRAQRAFAVVRPPGHHAECQRAMGFCFYNNVAVAAAAALATEGIRKVLILDWDVHHGNGIQDVHYRDPNVLFISLHRYGSYFYPGTGHLEDCGEGPGKGFNVNIPFTEKGLGNADYLAAFELIVEPIARDFRPDMVLIAAGFDAAEGDPLGGMCLTPSGYHHMTRRLVGLAEGGRVCAVMEGGYSLSALADCAEATLRGLLGEAPPPLGRRASRPRRSTEDALRAVADAQRAHWPSLRRPEYEVEFKLHFAGAHLSAQTLAVATGGPGSVGSGGGGGCGVGGGGGKR